MFYPSVWNRLFTTITTTADYATSNSASYSVGVTHVLLLLLWLSILYVAIEFLFGCFFYMYMVPRANRRTAPLPYLQFPKVQDRHKLLLRVLNRTLQTAQQQYDYQNQNQNQQHGENQQQQQQQQQQQKTLLEWEQQVITEFFYQWFYPPNAVPEVAPGIDTNSNNGVRQTVTVTPGITKSLHSYMTQETESMSTSSSDSSSSSTTGDVLDETPVPSPTSSKEQQEQQEEQEQSATWTIEGIYKEEMDEFLGWAMFGKPAVELSSAEIAELQVCYDILQSKINLVLYNKQEQPKDDTVVALQPRRLTLERLHPLHRPLIVYVLVFLLKLLTGLLLRCLGFQRVVYNAKVKGWYRPCTFQNNNNNDNTQQQQKQHPLLFFHGIAPGGILFYLPMVLAGMLRHDPRPLFLFENPNISTTLWAFDAFTEEEFCTGVYEIVNEQCGPNSQLALMGHSFGSCLITWILQSPLFRRKQKQNQNNQTRIQSVMLLDPVTILLSEPDVMVNFLYNTMGQVSTVRMFASSELFTEYYLRRQFAWYNSELWLPHDILPHGCHVTVALSEQDTIVNAPKVQQYISLYNNNIKNNNNSSSNDNSLPKIDVIYWKDAEHGSCLSDPCKWKEIRKQICHRQQEDEAAAAAAATVSNKKQ